METVTRHPWNPGDITLRDLAEYKVIVRDPVCGEYRAYRVCGFPLPSSGGIAVLQMLKMLERFDLASLAPASFFAVHFVSEAGRLAFADRSRVRGGSRVLHAAAGPARRRVPAGALVADPRGREPATCAPGAPSMQEEPRKAADASLELPSTSHISIVDRYGNAVAMTTTIEDQFGSRLMTAGGFLLNNELTDFSFVPEVDGAPVANRVEPGKRPRSSMAPTIAYDPRGPRRDRHRVARRQRIINYVAKSLVGDHRLEARPAGGRGASQLRQPQRADGARGGHRGRGAGAQAACDRRRRRASCR